jgi:hypothetical protein
MFLILLVLVAAVPLGAQYDAPPYRIAAITAHLFYNYTGGLSENIIDNPDFILWNTIIGEGSAAEPSDATLVKVFLEGQSDSYEPGRRVVLTSTEEGTVVTDTADLGVFGPEGYVVGFWLEGTGCFPVELEARLTGQPGDSKMKARIDFFCGE